MAQDIDSERFSETQRAILRAVLENPSLSNAEVAAETGARITLVRDTRETYADEVTLSEGETATDQSASGEITDAQQAILQTVSANPSLTNAEIAEKTGTRIALVRDTRDKHGAEYVPPDGSDTAESTTGSSSALSAAQQAILQAAEADPSLTNAEIAEQTDSRITLVRDTREEHGAEYEASTGSDDTGGGAGGDDELTEAQQAIVAAAAADPSLTNAEIAEQTDSRITLVRDTRTAYSERIEAAAEETQAGDDAAGDDTSSSDETAAAGELTEIQREIIHAAEDDPTLTNAEIAEVLGVRIATVRDTRDEFGAPDESAVDESDAPAEPAAEETADSTEQTGEPADDDESTDDESTDDKPTDDKPTDDGPTEDEHDESEPAGDDSSAGSAGPSGGTVLVIMLVLLAVLVAAYFVAIEQGLI